MNEIEVMLRATLDRAALSAPGAGELPQPLRRRVWRARSLSLIGTVAFITLLVFVAGTVAPRAAKVRPSARQASFRVVPHSLAVDADGVWAAAEPTIAHVRPDGAIDRSLTLKGKFRHAVVNSQAVGAGILWSVLSVDEPSAERNPVWYLLRADDATGRILGTSRVPVSNAYSMVTVGDRAWIASRYQLVGVSTEGDVRTITLHRVLLQVIVGGDGYLWVLTPGEIIKIDPGIGTWSVAWSLNSVDVGEDLPITIEPRIFAYAKHVLYVLDYYHEGLSYGPPDGVFFRPIGGSARFARIGHVLAMTSGGDDVYFALFERFHFELGRIRDGHVSAKRGLFKGTATEMIVAAHHIFIATKDPISLVHTDLAFNGPTQRLSS